MDSVWGVEEKGGWLEQSDEARLPWGILYPPTRRTTVKSDCRCDQRSDDTVAMAIVKEWKATRVTVGGGSPW